MVPADQTAAAEEFLVDFVLQSGGSINVKDLKLVYDSTPWLKDALGDLKTFVKHSHLLEHGWVASGDTGKIRVVDYAANVKQESLGQHSHMPSRKRQLWRWSSHHWKSSRRHDGRRFSRFIDSHLESHAKLLTHTKPGAARQPIRPDACSSDDGPDDVPDNDDEADDVVSILPALYACVGSCYDGLEALHYVIGCLV